MRIKKLTNVSQAEWRQQTFPYLNSLVQQDRWHRHTYDNDPDVPG